MKKNIVFPEQVNNKVYLPLIFLFLATSMPVFSQAVLDLSGYASSCGITVHYQNYIIYAQWETVESTQCNVRFDLREGYPLFNSILMTRPSSSSFSIIARNIHPRFDVSIGSRPHDLWPYIFFDCVDARPFTRHTAVLDPVSVKVVSEGSRVSFIFSTLKAGSFSGDLVVTIYNGSPLLHVEAAMTTEDPWVAYIYDALLSGDFETICFKDTGDQLISITPSGALSGYTVRNRTITASFSSGSIAVFPPPHAYAFPCDFSINQGFVQAGEGVFGTRQAPSGDGGYRPWITAQPGQKQYMGVFLLISRAGSEQTLERVKQYTHNDSFKDIPGYVTMTHHYHPEITLSEMQGYPSGPDFVNGMKAMNVNIAQPLEFHCGGALNDTGTARLEEMRLMFQLFEQYSDGTFTLIPGEEPNIHLGDTHWAYMFPRPVFYTQQRDVTQPFVETIQPYGTVYHLGSEDDVYEMLKREEGIGLTSHPRIKSSRYAPDNMAFREIVRDDDIWFGSDWKAMPLDLSEPRLGSRSFQVLDDFLQRGYKKKIIGEVDTFELHPDHEIYAHMNINYLKLSSIPAASDWSPVFNVVKNGDYFTTTGEVLIHSFSADTAGVHAELEWTFPLSFAEIIYGEGDEVKRHTIYLPDTQEFGRQSYSWNLDLSEANWVRFEAWDIARNGAFTQAFWLKTPVPRGEFVTNFTLINADTDAPVPGYDPIPDNAHIDLSTLPTRNLNIKVNTNPWLVGSVRIGLDENDTYCIESSWPYALASDDNQSYNAWTPAAGTHTVTATPYSDMGAGGTAGKPKSVSFTVIDTILLKGDVNEDSSVDIVDALLTAQYYVGLDPQGFLAGAADVNCSGTIDIVDALLIAQYYVGLITGFC